MIVDARGNLLEAQADALVNTVNTDGFMGKGIALQFKRAYPENFRAYESACRSGEVVVGKMLVVETGQLRPRYIINFPTKRHWRAASKLEYVRAGLVDLVAQARARGIRSIAVPPLGCGLGGLDWRDVRPLITVAFEAVPDVQVLLYMPAGAPRSGDMLDATARPAMTPGRAAVIVLMNRYLRSGFEDEVTLIEIQKLAYFLQEAGEPLRLKYTAHHYGPYADNLRHVLNHLEGHYTQGLGDATVSPEAPLRLLPGAAKAAEDFLGDASATAQRMALVASLIDGFETPLGMELLATTHWVMKHHARARASADAAVEYVHSWNTRKARLMEPDHIRAAWDQIRKAPWLLDPRAHS